MHGRGTRPVRTTCAAAAAPARARGTRRRTPSMRTHVIPSSARDSSRDEEPGRLAVHVRDPPLGRVQPGRRDEVLTPLRVRPRGVVPVVGEGRLEQLVQLDVRRLHVRVRGAQRRHRPAAREPAIAHRRGRRACARTSAAPRSPPAPGSSPGRRSWSYDPDLAAIGVPRSRTRSRTYAIPRRSSQSVRPGSRAYGSTKTAPVSGSSSVHRNPTSSPAPSCTSRPPRSRSKPGAVRSAAVCPTVASLWPMTCRSQARTSAVTASASVGSGGRRRPAGREYRRARGETSACRAAGQPGFHRAGPAGLAAVGLDEAMTQQPGEQGEQIVVVGPDGRPIGVMPVPPGGIAGGRARAARRRRRTTRRRWRAWSSSRRRSCGSAA